MYRGKASIETMKLVVVSQRALIKTDDLGNISAAPEASL